MSSITDRILALDTEGKIGTMVYLDDVLAIVKNAIPVEIDPTMYSDADVTSDGIRLMAMMSTVYNLLAETAAEEASKDLRFRLTLSGVLLAPDEEVFADPTSPVKSYRDLAVHNPDRVAELVDVFTKLVKESIDIANEAATKAFTEGEL